jgi:hypothetical protein
MPSQVRRSYPKKRSVKRKVSSRRKAPRKTARRAAAYVPKPEVKIFQDPALDLDTNQIEPASVNFVGGSMPAGSVSLVRTLVTVPAPWALANQGTGQAELIGRRCYVQSLKQMFRINFDGIRNNPINPRLRVIHGWCVNQSIAQGTPMTTSPNMAPVQVWGEPSWHQACCQTNVAQQLQFKLTTPNTKVLKVLSDRVYFAKSTAGANEGAQMTFNRIAIEFTKYWPMKRQLNWKEAPSQSGTASEQFVPQQQEPIPFTAFIWDNATSFSNDGSTDVIKIESRAQMRVLDN